LTLIQLREKSFAPERLRALADKLLAISGPYGARVLLNGDAAAARAIGCAGVHWSAARLLAARTRPDDLLCAASTHDAAELAHAAGLGVDFVVLGPVAETPTHPDARPLGWQRFAELAAGSPMPVYALGGLSADDLGVAVAHGAHGVALRRAAWGSLPARI
jgi:8-oxo-dGTP diphosphatase